MLTLSNKQINSNIFKYTLQSKSNELTSILWQNRSILITTDTSQSTHCYMICHNTGSTGLNLWGNIQERLFSGLPQNHIPTCQHTIEKESMRGETQQLKKLEYSTTWWQQIGIYFSHYPNHHDTDKHDPSALR